jgi:hypothetical protein
VVAIFSGNLAEGRSSKINGTGEQTRDYVFVGDVAGANTCWPWRTRLALENEVPSGAYNVGTAVETSVNELYDQMGQLSGSNLLPESWPQLPGEQRRSCVDPSRAARALNGGLRLTWIRVSGRHFAPLQPSDSLVARGGPTGKKRCVGARYMKSGLSSPAEERIISLPSPASTSV